jgi:hypothetical protein
MTAREMLTALRMKRPAEIKQNPENLVTEWYNMFRQYPEIFPDAYFRFLKANLEESLNKGTYIYNNGVLLTWKQYQKGNDYAKPGDFSLEKMVSANPGNGQAQKTMTQFLKKVPRGTVCYLKVAAHNSRAICFYKKNEFRQVSRIDFGSIPGLLMKRG